MTQKSNVYHVLLPESEDWKLADLYRFPHAFEQCYSFVYCLDTDLPSRDRERVDAAFTSYPFRGGYSYVNIYSVLARQIPTYAKPRVSSIHKASPGWLDLALDIGAAVEVAKAVATIITCGAAGVAAYSTAYKLLINIKAERERAKLKVMLLRRDQIKAVSSSCKEIAETLGFKSLSDLHRRTGDPEVSLKLLLAHYRRLQVLADYVVEGKVVLPMEDK